MKYFFYIFFISISFIFSTKIYAIENETNNTELINSEAKITEEAPKIQKKEESKFSGLIGRFFQNKKKDDMIFFAPFLLRAGYFFLNTTQIEYSHSIYSSGFFFDIGGEIFKYGINKYISFISHSNFGWYFSDIKVKSANLTMSISAISLNFFCFGFNLTENFFPKQMSLDLYGIVGFGDIITRTSIAKSSSSISHQLVPIYGFGFNLYFVARLGITLEYIGMPVTKFYIKDNLTLKLSNINILKLGIIVRI